MRRKNIIDSQIMEIEKEGKKFSEELNQNIKDQEKIIKSLKSEIDNIKLNPDKVGDFCAVFLTSAALGFCEKKISF